MSVKALDVVAEASSRGAEALFRTSGAPVKASEPPLRSDEAPAGPPRRAMFGLTSRHLREWDTNFYRLVRNRNRAFLGSLDQPQHLKASDIGVYVRVVSLGRLC
jgi:hypothetical protein